MKKTLLLFALLLGVYNISTAQQAKLDPVRWTYSVEKISDTRYRLVLSAHIQDNWHIYSQKIGEGGPIPTSFKFIPSKEYHLTDSIAQEIGDMEKVHDKGFDMDLIYFSKQVKFIYELVLDKPGLKEIKGTLMYMVCDNSRCLPPKEVPFSFDLGGAR